MAKSRSNVIRAAGGVVWRDESYAELAVIYRDRHDPDECCLPKGKLDAGESWEQAAVREVLEETGCQASISKFADAVDYLVGERPKIVIFFEMIVVREGEFVPSGEVRATKWLSPEAALDGLSHDVEREVVRNCLKSRR